MAKRTRKTTRNGGKDALDQLTVRISRGVHHRLQEAALKRRQTGKPFATQAKIVEVAVTDWLDKHQDEKRAR